MNDTTDYYTEEKPVRAYYYRAKGGWLVYSNSLDIITGADLEQMKATFEGMMKVSFWSQSFVCPVEHTEQAFLRCWACGYGLITDACEAQEILTTDELDQLERDIHKQRSSSNDGV